MKLERKMHLAVHQMYCKYKFRCHWSRCQKTYKRNKYLRRHKKAIHLMQRSYCCHFKDCKVKLLAKTDLVKHRLRHSKGESFQCDWSGCPKRFRYWVSLKQTWLSNHFPGGGLGGGFYIGFLANFLGGV